jgi:general secretion pathway protein G
VPVDPWGNPYVYIAPGDVNPSGYDLFSYGADGRAGGEGEDADILGWQ